MWSELIPRWIIAEDNLSALSGVAKLTLFETLLARLPMEDAEDMATGTPARKRRAIINQETSA